MCFYLFLAALDLRCCAGFSLVAVHGLLIGWLLLLPSVALSAQAAVVVCCRVLDQLLCCMWDLPGPGLEPVSSALSGRFLTTRPPEKHLNGFYYHVVN